MSNDLTGREDFVETWLFEMPKGLGSFATYDGLIYGIKDLIAHGQPVIDLGNGLFKLDGIEKKTYWIGSSTRIDLGVELLRKPQGLVVSILGKNPKLEGKTPYASDLYHRILEDQEYLSIRILSDDQLSDEGLALWKRMVNQGCAVSVYDRENPGKTFRTFKTSNELDQYFADDDTNFQRYQYVLSSNSKLVETRGFFNTRRFRELAGNL